MRKQTWGIALSLGLAIAFSIGAGGQAQASTSSSGYIECYTSGTFGQLSWSGFKVGTTGEVEVSLALTDMSADGHHPQIRLVTEYYSGDKHYWPWHAYYDGRAPVTHGTLTPKNQLECTQSESKSGTLREILS